MGSGSFSVDPSDWRSSDECQKPGTGHTVSPVPGFWRGSLGEVADGLPGVLVVPADAEPGQEVLPVMDARPGSGPELGPAHLAGQPPVPWRGDAQVHRELIGGVDDVVVIVMADQDADDGAVPVADGADDAGLLQAGAVQLRARSGPLSVALSPWCLPPCR